MITYDWLSRVIHTHCSSAWDRTSSRRISWGDWKPLMNRNSVLSRAIWNWGSISFITTKEFVSFFLPRNNSPWWLLFTPQCSITHQQDVDPGSNHREVERQAERSLLLKAIKMSFPLVPQNDSILSAYRTSITSICFYNCERRIERDNRYHHQTRPFSCLALSPPPLHTQATQESQRVPTHCNLPLAL